MLSNEPQPSNGISAGSLDQFTFLDFFAGVGLVEAALEPRWQCVWANDIDPKKQAIYAANFPDNRYLLGDVSMVSANQLPGQVDMAWASFPCQDLSLAGYRKGINGRRSGVFWSFHRLMRQLKERQSLPSLIVIENVIGLLYGQNFVGLCEALSDLGMRFGTLVMDAKHFVPQSRPRVFIVAVSQSVNTEAFETDDVTDNPWFSPVLRASVDTLPPYLAESWRWWNVKSPIYPVEQAGTLIDVEPVGVSWHGQDETGHLLNMMTTANRAKVDQALDSGERQVGFLYRRTRNGQQRAEVRFDGVAGCLRTPNGGSSRQTVVIVEKGVIRTRLISPREAARLMGAPESFKLPGTYNEAYKAMGDGVAVPVAKWLSDELLVPMAIAARMKPFRFQEMLPSRAETVAERLSVGAAGK